MPTLAVETVRTGGVTLVEVVVTAARPHRVRLESRLDGPVWPPRREGRPVDGWDGRGVSATVEEGTTAFGFATPASPAGTPVELVAAEPVVDEELPHGVAAWFDRVDGRLERAERLAAVDDLPSATRAVAAAGGLAAVESLAADLARDRRALSRLPVAPDDLCSRLAAVDIDLEAFARLAQTESRRS
jgi:hypothetical protein